jgi:proline iminopeptidase
MTVPSSRLVEVDGAQLEVLTAGSGEPVLCTTHQWSPAGRGGLSASSPFDAWASFGTLLMVNPRGAGNSSPALSPDDLSMRRLADDLERLRQHLGHARWVFAGFSAGGSVGLLYAVKYTTSLQGLILAATAPSGRFRYDPDCIYNPERADHAQIQAARDRALAADATPEDVRWWAQLVYHNPDVIERHVRAAEARAGRWSDSVSNLNPPRMSAMRAELEGTGGYVPYDVTDQLGQIHTPTLILGGRHDVSNPIRWSTLLHDGITGSELVVFEDSGHMLSEEEPEKFRDTILGFMKRIS